VRDAATPATTPTCVSDADCNDDLTVSTLLGECFQGYCFCHTGSFVQKDGKCGATSPICASAPDLTYPQCVQGSITCPAGQRPGDSVWNGGWGDLLAAVCCWPDTTCNGPDVSCCSKDKGVEEPVCVNGWLQCESSSPIAKGSSCN